jgi:tRNA A-37 threonylcarbamoyl transferase component Bud32
MTRMFGDFQPVQTVSEGAIAEGYDNSLARGFTIMQALYYLSAVADVTPNLPETPINGVAGQVTIPRAEGTPAPTIVQPMPPPPPVQYQQYGNFGNGWGRVNCGGIQITGDHESNIYDSEHNYSRLQFEPWNPENNLGPKTWTAKLLDNVEPDIKVVLKLWDAWNFTDEAWNREADIYLHLRDLWGKYVPALRVKAPLDYFYALIIENVPASSELSTMNLTPAIEREIENAFSAIHARGVVHGDPRAANILVSNDPKKPKVWIIDFEFGQIVDPQDTERLGCEMSNVKDILRTLKNEGPSVFGGACFSDHRDAITEQTQFEVMGI